MTSVVTNIKDMIEKSDIQVNCSNPKVDIIHDFMKVKRLARKSKEEIKKYTERNKNVRNGETVLTGTRITTKELMLIVDEAIDTSTNNIIEYTMKEYPSIDCKEKIIYGLLYEIKKKNIILFLLGL